MTTYYHCANCYYATDIYDKDGGKTGIECSKRNLQFVPIQLAEVQYCGDYSVREDRYHGDNRIEAMPFLRICGQNFLC